MFTLVRMTSDYPAVVGNYKTIEEAHEAMDKDIKMISGGSFVYTSNLYAHVNLKVGYTYYDWWICKPENE